MSGKKLTSKQEAELKSGAWFQSLPEDLQQALIDAGKVIALHAGDRLFARGDMPDGLYAVLSGAIRGSAVSAAGKEAILALAEPPMWFGEIALFDHQPRTHDAWADVETCLIHVPLTAFHVLLDAHPAYWRHFGRLLANKMRAMFNALEEVALLPSAPRVARRLLAMAEAYGDRRTDLSKPLEIRIPQEQLGLMVSLTRQTTNQVLKQFQERGAIRLSRGGIEILDQILLRSLAE
ncbi:MAG TPA: Crp/Fnr family transcriptional regulator [Rhodocyclaceae bacterium]|nr:Crp/Fnr family transcriptional regulator [Rhodocyclaceae bacterium]